jgi:hypothetical protein
MEFINVYNILIIVLVAILVIIYNLNKKLRKHDSQILTIEKDLNIQYEMISNLLDENDGFEIDNNNNKQNEINILPIELFPSDSELFRSELLKSKQAAITIYYNNGDNERKIWNASKINQNSNILGNIRSRQEFRNGKWQKGNIAKVVVAVEYNLSLKNPVQFKSDKYFNENTITKDNAIKLINKKFQLKLDRDNTNWSNINSDGIWSMEPNLNRKDNELYLILNNNEIKKLHVFRIPANHSVYENLYVRKDKSVFRLLFNVHDTQFIETIMHINFKEFYIDFLQYD